MPTPTNTQELRSFLGIINYYGILLPICSITLVVMQKKGLWGYREMIKRKYTFQEEAKRTQETNSILVRYDQTKPLLLACDAFHYGLEPFFLVSLMMELKGLLPMYHVPSALLNRITPN